MATYIFKTFVCVWSTQNLCLRTRRDYMDWEERLLVLPSLKLAMLDLYVDHVLYHPGKQLLIYISSSGISWDAPQFHHTNTHSWDFGISSPFIATLWSFGISLRVSQEIKRTIRHCKFDAMWTGVWMIFNNSHQSKLYVPIVILVNVLLCKEYSSFSALYYYVFLCLAETKQCARVPAAQEAKLRQRVFAAK